MMKMKNCLPLAAALMASALFLAACGANPPDERTPDAMVPAAEAAQSQAIRVDIQGQEVWFAPENGDTRRPRRPL